MIKTCSLSLVVERREAIPIRAILYLTSWAVGPLWIIESIANEHTDPKANLKSYWIQEKKNYTEVNPRDMTSILREMLTPGFFKGKDRLSKVSSLPENVFVWLDDFIECFHNTIALCKFRLARNSHKPLELSLKPFIEPSIQKLIHSGFKTFMTPLTKRSLDAIALHEEWRQEAKKLLDANHKKGKINLARTLAKRSWHGTKYSFNRIRTKI